MISGERFATSGEGFAISGERFGENLPGFIVSVSSGALQTPKRSRKPSGIRPGNEARARATSSRTPASAPLIAALASFRPQNHLRALRLLRVHSPRSPLLSPRTRRALGTGIKHGPRATPRAALLQRPFPLGRYPGQSPATLGLHHFAPHPATEGRDHERGRTPSRDSPPQNDAITRAVFPQTQEARDRRNARGQAAGHFGLRVLRQEPPPAGLRQSA